MFLFRGGNKMIFFQDTKILANEVIDEWSSRAEEAYKKAAGKRAESTVKFRITLEEILLRFRECFGEEQPCRIKGIKSSGGIRFELSMQGQQQNPLDIESELDMAYNMLARLNLRPQYVYRENRSLNIVTIPAPLKPKKNMLLLGVLVGVLLAVATWGVSGVLPGKVVDGYLFPFISELFSKMSAVFSALATPLVFCAVISGISGLGDVSSFGKLGVRLVKRMMISYVIAMVVMVAVGLCFEPVVSGSSHGENVFSDLLKLVLDIIPGNLVEPFSADNDLQVIVLAIFVGIVMLTLGDKVQRVRSLLDEAGTLFNNMMLAVCKLLPLFVYLGIANQLLGGKIGELGKVTRIIVIIVIAQAINIGITVIRAMVITKKPFSWMFKAQLPALLINITTSSQVSALPESMKCCKDRWKIDKKFTDFGLPFGIVVYMPNGAILLGTSVWVLSSVAMGGVDAFTLFKLVVVAVIVAIAAPPIPGSAVAVLPILFSASGTDLSLMPLAVIVASTLGYFLPAINGYCLQLELLMSAWKSDCIKKTEGEL